MANVAGGGEHLTFVFTLPNGPSTAAVFVVGGADADQDGKIQTQEVAAFNSNGGNVWMRQQDIQGGTHGTPFSISYSVGSGVLLQVAITNAAGVPVFTTEKTTVFAQETLAGVLV
jgi:hypothetical protein